MKTRTYGLCLGLVSWCSLAGCSSSGGVFGGSVGGDAGLRRDGGAVGPSDGGGTSSEPAQDGGATPEPAADGGAGAHDGGGAALPDLDGGTFSTCVSAYQCFLGCSTSGSACLDACLAATRPPASGAAGTLRDCIVTSCSSRSGSALADCIRTQCPGPAATCQQAECNATSRLVYVVDTTNRLLSFDPATATFQLLGTLRCDALGGTPFSMSVDHTGRAWVLYHDGQIYWVNTATAACQSSGYQPSLGALQFGMGFAAGTNGQRERLFVSVSALASQLEVIDPATLRLSSIGALPAGEYSPELSGTATAELYGYYPGSRSSFVAQLDPSSGHSLRQWNVPTLQGAPTAWAFAHWGGKFYLFVTDGTGSANSKVMVLDPATGQTTTLLQHLPYVIVGAGVSICAPIK